VELTFGQNRRFSNFMIAENHMSLQKVLEDWNDYERRKSRAEPDTSYFACSESWEVSYLVDKIKKIYPLRSGEEIHKAILQCCKEEPVPHSRRIFVKAVLNTLGLFV
jgi:hypothetical protein